MILTNKIYKTLCSHFNLYPSRYATVDECEGRFRENEYFYLIEIIPEEGDYVNLKILHKGKISFLFSTTQQINNSNLEMQ